MTTGLHHFHKRKRIHENLEPYPHPDKLKNFLDRIIYFIGIFTPIVTVPQLLEIWVNQNASGVSLISWAGYLIAVSFWLVYGLVMNIETQKIGKKKSKELWLRKYRRLA